MAFVRTLLIIVALIAGWTALRAVSAAPHGVSPVASHSTT